MECGGFSAKAGVSEDLEATRTNTKAGVPLYVCVCVCVYGACVCVWVWVCACVRGSIGPHKKQIPREASEEKETH